MSLAAESIMLWEGFSAKPYKCSAGVPTIGWGSTFWENGAKVKLSDPPISKERAQTLLAHTMEEFETTLEDVFEEKWFEFTYTQQAALVCFTFNCGVGTLKKCRFYKAIMDGEDDETIADLLADSVTTAKGVKLKGLQRRRLFESLLWLGEDDPKVAYTQCLKEFP